jgi:6-phosphogluconolactonase (cycloisomerase 2 family)
MSNVVVGGPFSVKYTPKTAYVTSTGDNTLSTYGVNSDGTLTTPQSTINLPSPSPFSLSLWPWGTDLVFASEGATPNIAFYSLSSVTGMPTAMGSLNNAATAGGAAIDPSGQFAFQTDSANGVVFTYEKLSSGGWALLSYQSTPLVTSFSAGPGAGPIVIDPAGLHVYVANQVANSISVYQYWGTSPQLFATTGSPFSLGAEPLLMAIDPNESFLYVVCGDHTLRVFSVAYFTGGTITQVASVSLAGLPSGLAVEPTGHFVYTSDGTGVSAFAVNSQTSALTAVLLNPAVALSNTTGVYAEPAGQYLYVTTGAQNVPGAVFGYSIHGDGTLTAISASPLATPKLPTSMTFSDNIQ